MTHYQQELAVLYKEMAQARRATGQRAEALPLMEKARAIQEKLAPLFPPGSPFQNDLADTWFEVAFISAQLGQRAEAVLAYQQCRALRLKLVEANPDRLDYRADLARALHNLATQYGPRGRTDDALAALREALAHTRVAFDKAPDDYRGLLNAHYFVYAEYLRTAGRLPEAVDANVERRKLWKDNVNVKEFVVIARELSLCADAVGKGKSELSPDDLKLRRRCCDLAVDVLRQTVDAGFKDAEQLERDEAFDPLRPRDDFKKLVADLTAKKS